MSDIWEHGRPRSGRGGRRPTDRWTDQGADPGRDPRRWRGLAYLLGITAATISGTAFFIGGLLAGAHGPVAIALAAAFPLAGLLWALTLNAAERARHPAPPFDPRQGRRPGGPDQRRTGPRAG
ncbi:MAG: hypothetical protein ACFCVK_09790 [Acidimicrobiales bacterium]